MKAESIFAECSQTLATNRLCVDVMVSSGSGTMTAKKHEMFRDQKMDFLNSVMGKCPARIKLTIVTTMQLYVIF